MTSSTLQTANLRLDLKSPEEVREFIANLPQSVTMQLSADWLSLVESANGPDPWIHGYTISLVEGGTVIGTCGFKGPPDSGGAVEIAYGIDPEYQGKGYATEAAEALTAYALTQSNVKLVRAHTKPEANASSRVLTKCGFHHLGEVMDVEDGLVWRWEKCRDEV